MYVLGGGTCSEHAAVKCSRCWNNTGKSWCSTSLVRATYHRDGRESWHYGRLLFVFN